MFKQAHASVCRRSNWTTMASFKEIRELLLLSLENKIVYAKFSQNPYFLQVDMYISNVHLKSMSRERYFQHSKIKFVSPRGHVISSISQLICSLTR